MNNQCCKVEKTTQAEPSTENVSTSCCQGGESNGKTQTSVCCKGTQQTSGCCKEDKQISGCCMDNGGKISCCQDDEEDDCCEYGDNDDCCGDDCSCDGDD